VQFYNAALAIVAGSIVGRQRGHEPCPLQWRRRVRQCHTVRIISNIAAALARLSNASVQADEALEPTGKLAEGERAYSPPPAGEALTP
jgi:hypothetical protein